MPSQCFRPLPVCLAGLRFFPAPCSVLAVVSVTLAASFRTLTPASASSLLFLRLIWVFLARPCRLQTFGLFTHSYPALHLIIRFFVALDLYRFRSLAKLCDVFPACLPGLRPPATHPHLALAFLAVYGAEFLLFLLHPRTQGTILRHTNLGRTNRWSCPTPSTRGFLLADRLVRHLQPKGAANMRASSAALMSMTCIRPIHKTHQVG
jgi:hypothetical protein